MFGYIKPVPSELKVKEYELYKSVYCGLCAALGRNASCVSRLTLSYDFVFLALVRMALAGEVGHIARRRCAVHLTKRRPVLMGADQLDYCARVSALLTYRKVRDDIADDRGKKRLAAQLLLPAAKGIKKRAMRIKWRKNSPARTDLAPLEKILAEKLAELSAIEQNGILSPDRAAEPFGELMAAVCAWGLDGDAKPGTKARIASEIGRHIGRFIYIVDAADDLASDLKSGAYNPFRVPEGDALAEFKLHADAVRNALTMELVGIERAVELIDFSAVPEFGSLLRNILYLGLPALIARIVNPEENNRSVMEKITI